MKYSYFHISNSIHPNARAWTWSPLAGIIDVTAEVPLLSAVRVSASTGRGTAQNSGNYTQQTQCHGHGTLGTNKSQSQCHILI